MAVLLVSFTIAWDDDDTYNKLHTDLHAAVTSNPPTTLHWCETTSFYVVQTNLNSAKMAVHIASTAGLRKSKDKLLVINMNGTGGAAWGAITDNDLYALLPFVKKL